MSSNSILLALCSDDLSSKYVSSVTNSLITVISGVLAIENVKFSDFDAPSNVSLIYLNGSLEIGGGEFNSNSAGALIDCQPRSDSTVQFFHGYTTIQDNQFLNSTRYVEYRKAIAI